MAVAASWNTVVLLLHLHPYFFHHCCSCYQRALRQRREEAYYAIQCHSSKEVYVLLPTAMHCINRITLFISKSFSPQIFLHKWCILSKSLYTYRFSFFYISINFWPVSRANLLQCSSSSMSSGVVQHTCWIISTHVTERSSTVWVCAESNYCCPRHIHNDDEGYDSY